MISKAEVRTKKKQNKKEPENHISISDELQSIVLMTDFADKLQ